MSVHHKIDKGGNFLPGIERELLTVDEVANLLRISVKTLRQWVYRGLVPNLKINGIVRFDRLALDGWIQQSSRSDIS